MKQKIALIGVPSSAGAHWLGQENAPGYLREAGLVTQLESVGLEVVDYGDLPTVRFQPDKEHRHQQNLGQVVEVCIGWKGGALFLTEYVSAQPPPNRTGNSTLHPAFPHSISQEFAW